MAADDETAECNRLALDAASLGTWRHEVATGILRMDARAQAMWGLARPDVEIPELIARIHPDDRTRVLEAGAAAARGPGDGRWAIDFRVVRPDGDIRWLSAR